MKKIVIKQCKGGQCSEGYEELYMDDKLILSGDSYHNSISVCIEGFLLAMKHLDIPHNIFKESIECKFYCD